MTKDIKKYDFKTGLPQEFEIVDLTELYTKSKHILTQVHRAGFYHIIWFEDCHVTHWVDFVPIKIKSKSLLFLNKDVVHRFDDKEKVKGKVLLFTDGFFCKTESDAKFLRQSVLFNDLLEVSPLELQNQTTRYDTILQLMTEEIEMVKDGFQSGILQNLLHTFLLISEREKLKQNFTNIKKDADLDYVLLFKDILETNFADQKQVKFYAKALIITEKRLNQATSKVFGKTPKEIIDNRIVLEAKRILAHTTESIKEIGYGLGFDEPTNFIKYFKKHASVTPTEFREQN
ncbi:MAG TPA: helix-turn-helix domain-containing protein [Saprospiraceae bacterium]|nr:helix-turn-helix domain-containing protein [Saprospiraceae bacterium]